MVVFDNNYYCVMLGSLSCVTVCTSSLCAQTYTPGFRVSGVHIETGMGWDLLVASFRTIL